MMRPLGIALMVMALPAMAGPLADAHLGVVPRSATEQAKVDGVMAPVADFSRAEAFEAMPGGAATTDPDPSADAFEHGSANLTADRQMQFTLGRALFRKNWVAAPASTRASDGLGPYYNARACKDCHINDGRGLAPEPGERAVSMILRLSVPGGDAPAIEGYLSTLPDPVYGGQLQEFAAPGLVAEGRMTLRYAEVPVTLAGGEVVTLRAPEYGLGDLAFGPLAKGAMLSPRVAPPMIGLGLLEAVPAAEILSREDPEDADGDGISGRANIVMSEEFGGPMLGRFGWKAGVPTLRAQVAAAFSSDMGLSNPLHPDAWGDCTVAEVACRAAPDGAEAGVRDGLEVDGESLDLVTFYARNLAVPERRGVDAAEVLRGKELFHDIGCAGCHQPKLVTHRLTDQPEQSFQLIWPFTDLLLHDMGEGLADNRPEGRANGREWRTAPLWGIGLTAQVAGTSQFLHDGRARTLLEAVLWHGGEAQAARDAVVALPPPDRAALLDYLGSL